jgi:hypothetical protein
MMAWLALAICVSAGWFLARALTCGAFGGPRWISVLIEGSLGALFGPGLASVGYFFLSVAGLGASRAGVWTTLFLLLAGSVVVWWRTSPSARATPVPAKRWPYTWALLLLAAAGFGLFVADFQTATSANPEGQWDAWAIWNTRSEFLAGGADTWHRAISSELGGHLAGAAHPGYPLFLSGFVALVWVTAGEMSSDVPAAASFLFSMALLALLGAAIASRRSLALGAAAWLLLLASTEAFASQAYFQYSDLPQGLAFLAALILLDSEQLLAAGLSLGLAAWIKNEGIPFALAGLAVAAWRYRARARAVLLGAIPGLAALVLLKMIATGREEVFPATVAGMLQKLAMPGRWWQALLGFLKSVADASSTVWAHPVILVAALVFALRFLPKQERQRQWPLWIPVAVTVAAEYGLYLITTADLDWHISTSVSRLLAQVWPALIFLTLNMIRTPEEYLPVEASAPVSGPAVKVPSKKKR